MHNLNSNLFFPLIFKYLQLWFALYIVVPRPLPKVCVNNSDVWSSTEELASAPQIVVQCSRTPQCVHHEYLSHERCNTLKSEAQWPGLGYVPEVAADSKTVRDLFEDHFMGKVCR